jgi:hypothetical protein
LARFACQAFQIVVLGMNPHRMEAIPTCQVDIIVSTPLEQNRLEFLQLYFWHTCSRLVMSSCFELISCRQVGNACDTWKPL